MLLYCRLCVRSLSGLTSAKDICHDQGARRYCRRFSHFSKKEKDGLCSQRFNQPPPTPTLRDYICPCFQDDIQRDSPDEWSYLPR